jgi:3-dehydroquinate synthase
MKIDLHPARPNLGADTWISLDQLRESIQQATAITISDRKVARLHNLEGERMLTLSAGERSKSFATLERLCEFIQHQRLNGGSRVYIVGGGTVGDVSALASHLVKRGMKTTMVPSTMLAAVDSSLGGKTAINAASGVKNAFGAYHFHDQTLIVPELWATLQNSQWLDGYAEAIKMAVCLDSCLALNWLVKRPDTETIVRQGRRLKREICDIDPFEETGKRFVLNFGHTLGHVLESLAKYKKSHGYCVALGMRFALQLGNHLGISTNELSKVVNDLMDVFNLPGVKELSNQLKGHSDSCILELLKTDKKGNLKFVLLRELGVYDFVTVDQKDLLTVLESVRELEDV